MRFDLLLLGIGSDGHTLSLFPGKPAIAERSRLVVGVPEAGLEPFVPRVSFTLSAVALASHVVFLAAGASKADALARAFGPDATPDPAVPSSMIPTVAPKLTLLDRRRRRGRAGAGVVTAVVGVDLGGTKIAFACFDGHELAESTIVATDTSSSEALIEQLVDGRLARAAAHELDGVGIGVPSIVEFSTGRVVSSANIPLRDVPLREALGERLGVPVFVDNDATVAALAEAHDDDLRMVATDLVMLTIGTGIGGGLVLGGRIYRGATGGAGELGHTMVGMDMSGAVPAAGRFPQPGSLEGEAAGHAFDALVTAFARSHPDSSLGRRLAAGEQLTGVQAVEAAQDGDADARRMIEQWGERVGIGIANAINTFDPEEVVIGGGAARAGELLLEPARRTAAAYVLPGLGSATTIRAARHGVRAGVLGAALLAAHELAGASQLEPVQVRS